jgi:EAL domain-containing protein (putative c-di-GMP-specific phosphodiesterase class I)
VVLSKRLGLKVVFEGVETSDLYQMTDHLGGDVIQGFYISKAVKANDVIRWIEDWHKSNR